MIALQGPARLLAPKTLVWLRENVCAIQDFFGLVMGVENAKILKYMISQLNNADQSVVNIKYGSANVSAALDTTWSREGVVHVSPLNYPIR